MHNHQPSCMAQAENILLYRGDMYKIEMTGDDMPTIRLVRNPFTQNECCCDISPALALRLAHLLSQGKHL